MIDRTSGDEISRYLDGAMSPGEASRFEARVASDRSLKQHVDAERAIRAAIANQVATMPREHAATRASLVSTLAALPRDAAPSFDPERRVAAPARSPLLKWLGVAGIGAAIIGGALMLDSRDDARPTGPASHRRADSPARGAVQAPPGDVDSTPGRAGSPAVSVATEAAASGRPAPRDPVAPTAAAPRSRVEADASARSTDAATTEPEAAAERDITKPRKRELRVIDRDSVRVRVGVDPEVRREP